MPSSRTLAVDAFDCSEIACPAGAPTSDWLKVAIAESVRREPLLAAEDAIMLVDMVVALSRQSLSIGRIVSNPLLGGWLKKAVTDNLRRPLEEVLRDTEFLRDVLVVNLFAHYRDGQLSGADVDIRICNIIDMLWGVGKNVVSQWSRNAAEHLKTISEAADGGLSALLDSIEMENLKGRGETAEILEQMSCLSEEELRTQLLTVSDSLRALKNRIQ